MRRALAKRPPLFLALFRACLSAPSLSCDESLGQVLSDKLNVSMRSNQEKDFLQSGFPHRSARANVVTNDREWVGIGQSGNCHIGID